MKKNILIYGAGAIGRGFIAPLLNSLDFEITFVDINTKLVKQLKTRRKYISATATENGYTFQEVRVEGAYLLGEEEDIISDYDFIFSCVGARNCFNLWQKFAKAKVVISCENDRESANKLRVLTNNHRIYFAIPDVITSNTAPEELLKGDPLTVVTEKGTLIIESGEYELPKTIGQFNTKALDEQWACKLYLHNTPHAIVAYLGWKTGKCKYIHEAMAIEEINKTVTDAMEELKAGIIFASLVTPDLSQWYVEKELRRFRNKFLYDPISRVAREPLRKISKGERLIGAAQLAFYAGVRPVNICKGIRAALEYENENDPDIVLPILRQALGIGEILKIVSDLNEYNPVYKMIVEES